MRDSVRVVSTDESGKIEARFVLIGTGNRLQRRALTVSTSGCDTGCDVVTAVTLLALIGQEQSVIKMRRICSQCKEVNNEAPCCS